jgi:hypothetical protein
MDRISEVIVIERNGNPVLEQAPQLTAADDEEDASCGAGACGAIECESDRGQQ